MRLRRLPLAVVTVAVALGAVGHPGSARSSGASDRLQRAESALEEQRRRGGVLTGELSRLRDQLDLAARRLRDRQVALSAATVRADEARARAARLQEQLRAGQLRLTTLRVRLARGRAQLARRLVELYKADQPDLLTVVLDADGFEELLEQAEFSQRVGRQHRRVLRRVAADRSAAAAEVKRLRPLERARSAAAATLARERTIIADATAQIAADRDRLVAARTARRRQLQSTRTRQQGLRRQVDVLQREQQRAERRLLAVQSSAAGPGAVGPTGPAGPGGGGSWRWPIAGTVTSPFCETRSWEACHPGVDVAAPSGTPIRATRGGRVVLQQPESASGGYGNFTCLDHGGGVSSCYAHQSAFAVSSGQAVSAGQVIGSVGSTGRSTGPHLHFEIRVNGSVVNPFSYL